MVNKFKYKLPFDWHFCYRHVVDDHKNLRHSLPSIEDTWVKYWWKCRVFAFIMVISEVNVFLILRYFIYCGLLREGMSTLLDFCRKLAWKLINNIYMREMEGGGEFFQEFIHRLMTASIHMRRYQNWRWICTEKLAYQKYNCIFKCEKKIRTYCVCAPGVWICSDCNVQHVLIASYDE